MALSLPAKLLAGGFAVSGTVHLVRPRTFAPLMPDWVPAHREVILGSGVAELLCAAGLALPATRKPAGYASALLLLGVWPGNVQMALDARRSRSTAYKAVAWARVPLQVPMVRAALRAARS
jgi:uncharacterized membrane protein